MPFLVAGDKPYNIFGGPGYCAVASPTSTMSCANVEGDGGTPAEQFIPFSPSNSIIISPGDRVLWKSNKTGLFCRVTNTSANLQTIVCDQSSASLAAAFIFSGTISIRRHSLPLLKATGISSVFGKKSAGCGQLTVQDWLCQPAATSGC